MVGDGQIHPGDAKVAAVRQFRQPNKKKEVWAFLGLAEYYRKFVPHFAEVAVSLTEATKKDAPEKVKWIKMQGFWWAEEEAH